MTKAVGARRLLAVSAISLSFGWLAQGVALAQTDHAGKAPVAAATQPAKAAKPAADKVDIAVPDITYTKFVLKNGLTLLVHEDHKTPVVAVNTWYHVGSKNEQPGKTGFAHLFEHLMFSGSDNFDHTYINAMERIGATNLNGTTNVDRTNYFENVPTSMLDYTLFAESDRMGHLLGVLDQKKLDLQRGVVQNEKRQGENQPYGVTRQILTENTFPVGHPYSWTTIGSMQDLNAASMKDVQDWFKTNYGPNNVVLVLAGDITPQAALQKVEKYYGEIPAGPPLAKQSTWIAKRTGTHRATVQDRVPQARLYRVWNVPQAYTQEEALLDLAAEVLGGGKTSRLYKRLVYQEQIATQASAENESWEIAGQFTLNLTAVPGGHLHKVESSADEELQKFLKSGPTEAELQLAKTTILGNYVRTMERVGGFGGKSDVIARCATFTGDPDCYKNYLKWLKEATPASVTKAANAWLSDGDFVLEVKPYPSDYATAAKLDRSKEPAPGAAENLNLPAMQRATLSNGLQVVLAERHTAPIVNFSMMIDSGYAADAADLPGVTGFAMRMLTEGTPSRDSLKISEELEGLSAHVNAAANLDGATANMNVLKATMARGLDIYADLLLHPAFPEKEFERLKKDRLAAIRREKVTPQAMALRVVPGLLYGNGHPYAAPFSGMGTEAAVEKMTREDLVKFHHTWFKPNNAILLIVGDTTLAEITPQLERAFAGWKAAEVPKKQIKIVQQPSATTIYLIDRPGAQQSIIVGAQLAPPTNDPESVPLDLVNDVFGGSFSSRANMNLREDKHWSYGIRSLILNAKGQRMFLSLAPVQSDKTKEALQQMALEYRNIAGAKPITADELKDAQSNDVLGLPGEFETVEQLSGNYASLLQYKRPDDYFNTVTDKILQVTPEQANVLAKRLVLPDHLIWVVVGDMKTVEAGIRELNMGEIHKVDADGNPVK
jgi:zinc protease